MVIKTIPNSGGGGQGAAGGSDGGDGEDFSSGGFSGGRGSGLDIAQDTADLATYSLAPGGGGKGDPTLGGGGGGGVLVGGAGPGRQDEYQGAGWGSGGGGVQPDIKRPAGPPHPRDCLSKIDFLIATFNASLINSYIDYNYR